MKVSRLARLRPHHRRATVFHGLIYLSLMFLPHAAPAAAADTATLTSASQGTSFECIATYGEVISTCTQVSHYVYLNQGRSMRVLDIIDPAHPKVIGWFNFDSEIRYMSIRGPALYVELSRNPNKIFDITDPAHPRPSAEAGDISLNAPENLMGNFVLTEGYSKNRRLVDFDVFDHKNPLKPTRRIKDERYITGGNPNFGYFATDGTHLFQAERGLDEDENGNRRVAIRDVTTSPTTLGWCKIKMPGEDAIISLRDGQLIAADSVTTIPLANVKPSDTVWIYRNDDGLCRVQEGEPAKLAAPIIPPKFTAQTSKGELRIYENVPGSQPALRSIYGAHAGAEQFKIAGRRGYLLDGDKGLQILDLSDPAAPKMLGRFDLSVASAPSSDDKKFIGTPTKTGKASKKGGPQIDRYIRAVEDNLVFLSGGAPGFRVIDCSNPGAPVVCSRYSGSGGPMSIQSQRAYIAAGNDGLQILDLSNPAAIRPVGRYATLNPATDLATSGSLIYLLAKDLLILNVANAARPVLLSSTTLAIESDKTEALESNHQFLKKLGPALYFIQFVHEDRRHQLAICKIIDISNPTRPRPLIAQLYSDEIAGEEESIVSRTAGFPSRSSRSPFAGSFLCLPSNYYGIRAPEEKNLTIYDLADPLNPAKAFRTSAVSRDDHVALYKNTLYLADGPGGLVIMRPSASRR